MSSNSNESTPQNRQNKSRANWRRNRPHRPAGNASAQLDGASNETTQNPTVQLDPASNSNENTAQLNPACRSNKSTQNRQNKNRANRGRNRPHHPSSHNANDQLDAASNFNQRTQNPTAQLNLDSHSNESTQNRPNESRAKWGHNRPHRPARHTSALLDLASHSNERNQNPTAQLDPASHSNERRPNYSRENWGRNGPHRPSRHTSSQLDPASLSNERNQNPTGQLDLASRSNESTQDRQHNRANWGRNGPHRPANHSNERTQNPTAQLDRASHSNERTQNRPNKSRENWGSNQPHRPARHGQSASQSKIKSKGVETSGQLALFAAADYPVDLRARLSEQLVRGMTECMVCLDRVKQTHATWDCHNCYQVFHIHCIKKWSKTAQTDTGGWRCPGCQAVTAHVPKEYRCFCRKLRDPEWNRNQSDVPHSCGEVCGRQRNTEGCVHKCVDLCHPGPCPPCNSSVNRSCPCGLESRMVKCGVVFHCEGVCSKPLNCASHQCPDICHDGPCYDCHENVEQSCYCGKAVQEVLCTPDTAGVKDYSCESVCERTLDCENHQCDVVCHSGPCRSCVLTTELVTTCPCGQTRLEKLYERDGVQPRTSCLDPVPTCGLTCGIKLRCGAPSTPHTCSALCHAGPCPTCPNTTEVKCRCGHMDREINCSELVSKADDARCDKRCSKKRSCGRHKCGQPCCIDIDHVCPLVCGKLLSCTLHRCEEMCHRGNCPTCPRTSFDELSCSCGAAVIYPPVACGTRPPECQEVCRRPHSCEHPVTHSCHSETNCPPCTQLTVKKCFGGHEERKNVACLVEGISCGKPCGKMSPCGKHRCIKVCHAGCCLPDNSTCQQPCATPRHECTHPCSAPCHEGSPCPDTPCTTQERTTCECGHRSATMSCAENSYNRVTTALLATRMADMQAGNSVNLADLARRDRRLECTEECGKIERNKRVALALQIRNPELTSKITPRYSEFMKDWVKKDPVFCNMIHEKLTELVKLAKESKQKSRAYSFDCMNRDKRQLVHEYAELFGCESESYDAEPKRNVVATALKDKSWLPPISLIEFVQKQKRAPGPVLSTTVTKPTLVSMSKATGESTTTTDAPKIDWFD